MPLPGYRQRHFEVTHDEIVQVLGADESDEEALALDEEDASFLEENRPDEEGVVQVVEIDDAGLMRDEEEAAEPPQRVDVDIRWRKVCPPLTIPNPDDGLGDVLLNLDGPNPPSPYWLYQETCQLNRLMSEVVVPQSVLYMQQKGIPFETTVDEMVAFVGMQQVMSYHVLPDMRLYWSEESDLHVPVIADVMTRNRFMEIRRALHFADNTKAPDLRA